MLAFALAIAIHEILAGLIPRQTLTREQPEIVRVEIARVTHRAIPTPTPPPPPPSPRIVSHARTIAPVETRVIPQTTTGRSARKEIVHRVAASRPKPPVISHAKPIWDLPVGAQGAGAGKSEGAGSVGTSGTGTGAGTTGEGSGAAAGTEPCGFVNFQRLRMQEDPTTHHVWEWISINVHFPDKHAETQALDYPFFYPSKALDPFEQPQDAMPTLFQWPPDPLRAAEPPLVQYVMQHSQAPGFTLLKDCP